MERNLKSGRFLLLIVGDGIRENVEQMLTQLHQHPQMLFKFALVELQMYKNPSGGGSHLFIPYVIAKTTEIVRAVVHVETTGQAKVSVDLDESSPETKAGGRRKLSEEDFFSEITEEKTKRLYKKLFAFAERIGAVQVWLSSSVAIKLPDPSSSNTKITLLGMRTNGKIYVGWFSQGFENISLSKSIGRDYLKNLCKIFNIRFNKKYPDDALERDISAQEVESKYKDFILAVEKMVNRIKKESKGLQ